MNHDPPGDSTPQSSGIHTTTASTPPSIRDQATMGDQLASTTSSQATPASFPPRFGGNGGGGSGGGGGWRGEKAPQESQRPPLWRRILKGIYVSLRGFFALIGFSTVAWSSLMLLILVGGTSSVPMNIQGPVRLLVSFDGPLAEKQSDSFDRFFDQLTGKPQPIYLPNLRAALKRAGDDERVSRLVLDFSSLSGSLAELTELRRMIVDFRASGKPVYALLAESHEWAYYVASAADKIILNPASALIIPGPIFHLTYFGEALRKLGVDIEVLRAGKYKSAFEAFVSNAPSEATLEQYGAMEESLRRHLVESVAAGRKLDQELVRQWFERSVFTAADAKAQGLVDEIGYDIDSLVSAGELNGEESLKMSRYDAGTRGDEPRQEVAKGVEGIALIEATGEIKMTSNESALSSSSNIAPASMLKKLRWAARSDDVKAVVLRVSSPGGSAVASDMIWQGVKELAETKPVVVSMGAYAASGGYYIAAPAQKIVAEPTTITGSIGVIGMLPHVPKFEEKYGVSFHVVTQSKRAGLLNPGSVASPEDIKLMSETIDQVYRTFVEKVARGRKMPVERIDELAQGRVYTGLEALPLGLVDAIGGLGDAFKVAKELAGFDPEKLYPVLQYKGDGTSLEECLANPLNISECLDGLDVATSTAARGLAPFLWLASYASEEASLASFAQGDRALADVAKRLQSWLTARGEPLTLWGGYLGVSIH